MHIVVSRVNNMVLLTLGSINILRHTGGSQSLLVKDDQTFTGLIQGIKPGVASVPLHIVDLQSSLVSGPVIVGVVASLPGQGISLILVSW